MKLYLDTANVKEIQETASLGVLDCVTTNPSLVAKEGRIFREALAAICNIVDGSISAEVVSLELAKIHQNIVVKVPKILVDGPPTRSDNLGTRCAAFQVHADFLRCGGPPHSPGLFDLIESAHPFSADLPTRRYIWIM